MLRAADSILRTDTGRQRRDNEDNAYMRAPLYVVADGMGGAQAGEVASAIAVEEFRRGPLDDGPPADRLSDRVREANRRIYDTAQREHEHAGMGTTLTAVYLDDSDLAVAHVGDSRAYIYRDGELVRLTHDHSLVEELMRRGKLTPEQAAEHPQRSIITRALGIEPEVEVDTATYPMHAGDIVLLCSDGLTSMIDESQVAIVLESEPSLATAAERLIHEANEAGGRDNITVVLFRLEDVGDGPIGGDTALQDTVVGLPAVTEDTDPPARPTHSTGDGGATTMTVAPPLTRPRTPKLARTQGPPPEAPRRRTDTRRFKVVAALISLLIVVFLFGGGGYLATRQLYFVGTNANGIVTLYNGLPYDFIVPLYEQSYVSGVPASVVPANRRATLLNHNLRSQNAAIALIRAAERGQLSP